MTHNHLSQLSSLKDTIKEHNLQADKKLGQHFLLDTNLLNKIANAAGPLKEKAIIEIGPGPGGLTRALLNTGAKNVIAIEKDPRCVKALEDLKRASKNRLAVIEGDALQIDERTLTPGQATIIANLPYNISTALIIKWLQYITHFDSITIMLQKEVAERIVAQPRTKAYGRLSVMTQWLCKAQVLFNVPPQAFTPPPKVDSSILQLHPYKKLPYSTNKEALELCLKTAFNQRRKTLKRSLKPLTKNPEKILKEIDIPATTRPEELSIKQFCTLTNMLDRKH